MSEGEGSLSTGAESEAGNDSEAWATASSGSEGESESAGDSDSDGDVDSDSDVDSEGDSDSDLDMNRAQVYSDDEMSLAQTGAMTDAEFFSWLKKKAMAAKKFAMQKAAAVKRALFARLHRQRQARARAAAAARQRAAAAR